MQAKASLDAHGVEVILSDDPNSSSCIRWKKRESQPRRIPHRSSDHHHDLSSIVYIEDKDEETLFDNHNNNSNNNNDNNNNNNNNNHNQTQSQMDNVAGSQSQSISPNNSNTNITT